MEKPVLLGAILFITVVICSFTVWDLILRPAAGFKETSVKDEDSFEFAVLGDAGVSAGRPDCNGNRVLANLVQMINKDGPDFTVFTGDGPEQGSPIDNMVLFRETLSSVNSPWYPVIGNHEIYLGASPDGKKSDGEENFIKVFSDKLPLRDARGKVVSYYSFDYKETHFIVLDTAWQHKAESKKKGLYPGGTQWNWLLRDLQSARPKSRHIFIFGHEPPILPYPFKSNENINKLGGLYGTSWNYPEAAKAFIQLCRQYSVDAVFSGHIHTYFKFIDNNVTYLITGGAGQELHTPSVFGGFHHYVRCSVTGDQIKYEVVPLT